MHIHGNSMAVNQADFYAAAQNGKAAAAQRAAETRKKLLKGAAEIEGSATPDESLLIGHWMGGSQGQVRSPFENEDKYTGGDSGRDSELG